MAEAAHTRPKGSSRLTESTLAQDGTASGFTAVNGRDSGTELVNGYGPIPPNSQTESARPQSNSSQENQSSQRPADTWSRPLNHSYRQDTSQFRQDPQLNLNQPVRPSQYPQAPPRQHSHDSLTGKRKRSDSESKQQENHGAPAQMYEQHQHQQNNNRAFPHRPADQQYPSAQMAGHSDSMDLDQANRAYPRTHPNSYEPNGGRREWSGTEGDQASDTPRTPSLVATPEGQSPTYPNDTRPIDGTNGVSNQNRQGTADMMDTSHQDDSYMTASPAHSREDPNRAAHRQRKRNFTNRTKTGCLTCRRRKKKCDEAQPECLNCIRGSFICQGYSHQSSISNSDPPQRRTSFIEVRAGPMSPPSQYAGGPRYPLGHPPYGIPAQPGPPGPPHQPNPPHQPGQVGGHLNQPPQAGPSGASVNARQHSEEEMMPARDRQRLSMSTSSIDGATTGHPQQVPSAGAAPGPAAGAAAPPQQWSQQPLPNNAQLTAAAAEQHAQSARFASRDRDKMLAGAEFSHSAAELQDDRERCRAACWRFNQAANPTMGLSYQERMRMFADILSPHRSFQSNVLPARAGIQGPNCVVEAPFTAEYGYNLQLGADVFIGPGCMIMDGMTVAIGQRSYIGPNVQIYATSRPPQPERRQGYRGSSIAKTVTIGDDSYIAGGVIIRSGAHIGRGSTIEAGSVVEGSLPDYAICSGNPAKAQSSVNGERVRGPPMS